MLFASSLLAVVVCGIACIYAYARPTAQLVRIREGTGGEPR